MSWFELAGKDLISIKDWTDEELRIVLQVTDHLKALHYEGVPH